MAYNNDLTSSLQSHFICHYCNNLYPTKLTVIKHIRTCGIEDSLKCHWCNLKFKNRGNLATHALAMHGDSRYEAARPLKCQVCEKTFNQQFQLTYHIRRYHFNLQGKTPYCEFKKINQVWFENVLNSNNVMEIKKTGHNTLVMRKLDSSIGIKVSDNKTHTIDLTNVYPIYNRTRVEAQCHICKKMYLKVTLKKHIEEKHSDIRKHECNNCKKTFKRSYFYLRHICNKEAKKRGRPPIIIEKEKLQSLPTINVL